MNRLTWQAWTAAAAFVLTLLYVLFPGPYLMGAFTFVAQPLFLVAALGYGLEVVRELRGKQVL